MLDITPLDALYQFKAERTSFTYLDAYVYLLGYGFNITFDKTIKLVKRLEREGEFTNIRADPYNKSVFVTHE